MTFRTILVPFLAAAVAAACSDGPAGPAGSAGMGSGGLTSSEASTLALQLDVTSDEAVSERIDADEASFSTVGPSATLDGGSALSMDPPMGGSTTEISFTHTRTCPLGGEVVIEGTMLRLREFETRHMMWDLEATKTHVACTYQLPEAEITLNGNPNIEITGHREREMGRPVGLQTMSHLGSIAWEKSTGESGVCDVSIEAVVDPDAHTRTITGTFCGHEIDRTWMWFPHPGPGPRPTPGPGHGGG